MKFIKILRFSLIIFLPFIIFLSVLNFEGLDSSFYTEKFSEYKVYYNINNAQSLHEKVMNFINGKNNEIPDSFNQREKEHLWDVRNLIKSSRIILYILIALFASFLIVLGITLKVKGYVINLIGKILLYGGILTIILAASVIIFINMDFSSTFESFHRLFFKEGSYSFNPGSEIIVNLYPEGLFRDLGIRISKYILIVSIIIALIGTFLISKRKNFSSLKKS